MPTDAVWSLPDSPKQSCWLSPSWSSTPHFAPRQSKWHHSESPCYAGVHPSLPRAGVGSGVFSSKDWYSCSCSSIIPQFHALHQPLAHQSYSPSGCSRLVHAGSTWSLCCPIVVLVLLSRKAAFHEHTWFARSTVLPEQGQETNPPCWEELSRRQEPLMSAEAMQIWCTPLD